MMASLQGPVICPVVRAKKVGVYTLPANHKRDLWGFKGISGSKLHVVTRRVSARNYRAARCSFSSFSDGNGSKAENFDENDDDYVTSSILEAGMIQLFQCDFYLFMYQMTDPKYVCSYS